MAASSKDTPTSGADRADRGRRGLTVYGRQGSPSFTVALPFSRIETVEDSHALAAVAETVELVRRLAEAAAAPVTPASRAQLRSVADDSTDLLLRLSGRTDQSSE